MTWTRKQKKCHKQNKRFRSSNFPAETPTSYKVVRIKTGETGSTDRIVFRGWERERKAKNMVSFPVNAASNPSSIGIISYPLWASLFMGKKKKIVKQKIGPQSSVRGREKIPSGWNNGCRRKAASSCQILKTERHAQQPTTQTGYMTRFAKMQNSLRAYNRPANVL